MTTTIRANARTLFTAVSFLAKRVTERRNTIPALAAVRIDAADGAVIVSATDLDLSAAFSVEAHCTGTMGSVAVDAALLADVLKRAGRETVTLSYDDAAGSLAVLIGGARSTLLTTPIDHLPDLIDATDKGHTFTLDATETHRDMARLIPFVSVEKDRDYLTGVSFATGADDAVKLAATDGKRIALIDRTAPDATAAAAFILPTKAAVSLSHLLKDRTGPVSVAVTGHYASFTIDGARVLARLIDGAFPDVERAAALGMGENVQRLAFTDLEPNLCPTQLAKVASLLKAAPDADSGESCFMLSSRAAPEFRAFLMFGLEAKGFHDDAGVRFIDDDGNAHAIRTNAQHCIQLSADAVRRLAGPVDPSTFVPIPAKAFYQGRVLADGMTVPTPPVIAPHDALRMSPAQMAAYADACRPIDATAAPVAEIAPASVETLAPAVIVPAAPVDAPHGPEIAPAVDVAALLDAVAALSARVVALEARPTVVIASPVSDAVAVRRAHPSRARAVQAYLRHRAVRDAIREERAAFVREMAEMRADMETARADADAARRTVATLKGKRRASALRLIDARAAKRRAIVNAARLAEATAWERISATLDACRPAPALPRSCPPSPRIMEKAR